MTDPDTLVAAVRSKFGNGELTFRSEPGILIVAIADKSGRVRMGSGGSVVAALRNLLNGGCANA